MGGPEHDDAGGASPVHFLVHVPKCAGTTVEHHFQSHLGDGFLIAPRWESVWRNVLGNRYPYGPSDPRLARVRAVSGHSLSVGLARFFPGRDIRESVLIRQPQGFFLSNYNYRAMRHAEGWGPEPPAFETWYSAQRRNPITRFLLSRYFDWGSVALYRLSSSDRLAWLEERLARFHFVGQHRHAGEMIAGISREMGLPETVENRNVTTVRAIAAEELPDRLRLRIAEENPVDQALWDRWGDRKWAGQSTGTELALPRLDQARLLATDTAIVIRRKLLA